MNRSGFDAESLTSDLAQALGQPVHLRPIFLGFVRHDNRDTPFLGALLSSSHGGKSLQHTIPTGNQRCAFKWPVASGIIQGGLVVIGTGQASGQTDAAWNGIKFRDDHAVSGWNDIRPY